MVALFQYLVAKAQVKGVHFLNLLKPAPQTHCYKRNINSIIMQIEVKDPATGALLLLEAKPERYLGKQGYRIRHPNGSGFLIINRLGAWRSADDHRVEPELLANIGLALEGHQLKEQIAHTN